MTHSNRTHSPSRTRSQRRAPTRARRERATRFSDAVMAAYIHELSVGSRALEQGSSDSGQPLVATH